MQGAVPKYCHLMDAPLPHTGRKSVESVADVEASTAPYCDPDGCVTTQPKETTQHTTCTHIEFQILPTGAGGGRGGWELWVSVILFLLCTKKCRRQF